MSLTPCRYTVVVGSGGVGKTTVAAALGLQAARAGHDTLVMTFDPSLRLKDALGVDEDARDAEMPVAFDGPGRLSASLLDAGRTFDRIVHRYAPDEASASRILDNRYYSQLSGNLAGILEYMAVERLYEVAVAGRYDRVILDTPPTRQAMDLLGAPERIIAFLDSGAIRIAVKPWFDPSSGRLRLASKLGALGRRFEGFLDKVVGLELLRDMAEFFQAFEPLYAGFRERAEEVSALLRTDDTEFLLVSGPGEEFVPDTLFFARKLREAGHRLGPLVVNRLHPSPEAPGSGDGRAVMEWLARRDRQGLAHLRSLVTDRPVLALPLLDGEPATLDAIEAVGRELERQHGGTPVSV